MNTSTSRARRRGFGAAAGLTAALLAASAVAMPTAASAAQGAWQPSVNITPGVTQEPQNVKLATAANGAVTAVWSMYDGTFTRIRTATKAAGSNSWGASKVLTTNPADCYEPSVVIAPNGHTAAAWTCYESFQDVAYAATRAAGSTTWSAPVRLSAAGQDMDYDVTLTAGANGTISAGWTEDVGAYYAVRVATRASGAAAWTTTTASPTTTNAWSNTVGIAPNGSTTVVYETEVSGDYVLKSRTKAKGSSSWGTAVTVTAPGAEGWYPQLGFAANSTAILVWESYTGDNDFVVAGSRKAGVTAWTRAGTISEDADTNDLQLAVAPNGSAVATWIGYETYDRAEVAHFTAGAWGKAITVSGSSYMNGEADADDAEIAVGADGTFVLAWSRDIGAEDQAETATWTAATGRWSKATVLSTVGRDVDDVAVTVANDGTATAAWNEETDSSSTLFAASTKLPKPVVKSAVKGTAKTGATLTCAVGVVHGATKPTLSWTRNGVAVKGATTASYKLTGSDFGKKVACRATVKNAAGTTVAASAAVLVKVGTNKSVTKPKVTGKAKVGKKLKATKGSWAAKPSSAKYQWYRGAAKIKGATKASYTTVAKDKGKKLSVKVTVNAKGYAKASAKSKAKKIK